MTSVEDESLKQRLLLDERKFNDLVKDINKWSSSPVSSIEVEKSTNESINASIAQCHYAIAKNLLIMQMNGVQTKQLDAIESQIECDIATVKNDITQLQTTLEQEKLHRANREIYHKKALEINKAMSRSECQQRLRQIEEEMETLQAERERVETRISLRQKQFGLLLHAAHQLQIVLYEPDQDPYQELQEKVKIYEEQASSLKSKESSVASSPRVDGEMLSGADSKSENNNSHNNNNNNIIISEKIRNIRAREEDDDDDDDDGDGEGSSKHVQKRTKEELEEVPTQSTTDEISQQEAEEEEVEITEEQQKLATSDMVID